MEYAGLLSLDQRLRAIMDDVRGAHGIRSILLADQRGLTISFSGEIKHAGIAAIAPEVIRMGDHARRMGEYDSITCVALVVEGSHLMIVKEVELDGDPFILVLETSSVPKSLDAVFSGLSQRIASALTA